MLFMKHHITLYYDAFPIKDEDGDRPLHLCAYRYVHIKIHVHKVLYIVLSNPMSTCRMVKGR